MGNKSSSFSLPQPQPQPQTQVKESNVRTFEIQILAKGVYTFIFNEKRELYIWGDNTYGQLGLNAIDNGITPTLLTLPHNEKVLLISSGKEHVVCLTEKNLCYVWGGNGYGQLGLGDKNPRLHPMCLKLPNKEQISFITCGQNYTMCLTENKACYAWGYNKSGQLGLGDNVERLVPILVKFPTKKRIFFISCGVNHTVCLTESNSCFIWGDNDYGQLGLGHKKVQFTPTSLTLPNREKIYLLACGSNHTVCLTENNSCYVWGSNFYGQLGFSDKVGHNRPTLFSLPNNELITYITCGTFHTMCLTEKNLCYAWGWNSYYGQVGSGEKIDHFSPFLLNLPNNEKFSFISCGERHSICISENNLIYAWGHNYFDQLGLGDTMSHFTPTLVDIHKSERQNSKSEEKYNSMRSSRSNTHLKRSDAHEKHNSPSAEKNVSPKSSEIDDKENGHSKSDKKNHSKHFKTDLKTNPKNLETAEKKMILENITQLQK